MAITVAEKPESRRWSNGACEWRLTVRGTSSDTAARDALLAAVPATYQGLVRQLNPLLDPQPGMVDETTGVGTWDAVVTYVRAGQYQPPESTIGTTRVKWKTGGGTQHVTACRRTVRAYGAGAAVGNTGDLVNVDSESKRVQGLDLVLPVFPFTVSKVFAIGAMPAPGSLFYATATVNNAPWTVTDTVTGESYTFAAGEVLFKGDEQGEIRADGGIEIVFEFEGSPNRDDIYIPETGDDRIGPIVKDGHQWLEVWYRHVADNTLGAMIVKPYAVYVEDLFDPSDFGDLWL